MQFLLKFMFRENEFLLFGGRYFRLAFLERESEDPFLALWLSTLFAGVEEGILVGGEQKI